MSEGFARTGEALGIIIGQMVRRRLLAVATLALILRLLSLVLPGLPAQRLWEDAAIARNVAAGHGYSHHRYYGPTAVKAPAYPLLLTPIAMFTRGDGPRADDRRFLHIAGVANAVLGSVAVLLTGLLGVRLFGDRLGALAALLLALHPSVIYLSRVPESTNLSVPLVAAAVLTLELARRRATPRAWATAGAMCGLAGLSNPISLPVLAITALIWGRLQIRGLIALGLATTATLTPWTIRNYLAFDRLVAIKSPLWLDVYAGLQAENLGGRAVLPEELIERIERRVFGLHELDRETIYAEELKPWLSANSGLVVRLAVWRGGQLWGLYGHRSREHKRLDILLRFVPEIVLLALTVAAVPFAWRREPAAALILIAFLAFYTLVYASIVAVNVRYHLEVVWAQMILVAVSIEQLSRQYEVRAR